MGGCVPWPEPQERGVGSEYNKEVFGESGVVWELYFRCSVLFHPGLDSLFFERLDGGGVVDDRIDLIAKQDRDE